MARPAPDLVERHFTAAGADQLWVADITYVPTWAGFLYLAVVVDAWSRRVIGWAMETHLRTELVLAALNMAVAQRRATDVIHHSDQGCQYTSIAFGKRCAEAGVRPSMGSVGDAYDNALCESFFATLECELLDRHRFRTQIEARLAVFDFIEGWYNPRRRHSALDYRSPVRFERTHSIGDRTVPAGSTIVAGGAISVSPQRRCGEQSRKQFTVHRTGSTPLPRLRIASVDHEILVLDPPELAHRIRQGCGRGIGAIAQSTDSVDSSPAAPRRRTVRG